MTRPRILVVEDENVARHILHVMLTQEGYEVTSVESGEEALEQLAEHTFDILLTDLQLRKVDGIQVMVTAHERHPDIEVIVLTGYATLDSAIAAVRHGAHNYILKPGQPGEIEQSVAEALMKRQARIDRSEWLRRLSSDLLHLAENPDGIVATGQMGVGMPINGLTLCNGDLVIDLQRYSVTRAGQMVHLSNGEFKLLVYLMEHRDHVISPQQLAREVLGYECTTAEARDLIKARIWALRRKIEANPTEPDLIISIRGAGYMLASQQKE